MSVGKGPNTGPVEFAGVDVSTSMNREARNDSVADTVVATPRSEEEAFSMPAVDLEYAAGLQPSRVRGKQLLWMITFVCGTGVSILVPHLHTGSWLIQQFICFGYDQGVLSSLLTLPSFIETFPETASGFGSAQSLLVAICELLSRERENVS